jgi:ubiquinone/menaquinone biosynthesis C-methylase UbiE
MIYERLPKFLKAPYKKIFWRLFYNYIEIAGKLRPAKFLNHGYAEEGVTIDNISLAEVGQLPYNLYMHLFEQAPPTGKHVLEIGCGRGAGLAHMKEQYQPERCVGLDLSDANIRRCKKLYSNLNIEFVRGDAEKQVFPDKTFDIVFNLESSHCYVSKRKFYENVYSILKDDGYFVYSDAFWIDSLIKAMEKEFDEVGFYIEKKEDISAQVFRSIEIKSFIKQRYLQVSATPKKMMNNFVAGVGSDMYEWFKNGSVVYTLYVLRKK